MTPPLVFDNTSLEIARRSFVARYRNPGRATAAARRIAYEKDAGGLDVVAADFLVISRRSDDSLGVSIVD